MVPCFLLKAQENKFHIKINNTKVCSQMPHNVLGKKSKKQNNIPRDSENIPERHAHKWDSIYSQAPQRNTKIF